MKILHVTDYGIGGAGIAAYRLHTALRQKGLDSKMLVRRQGPDDPCVEEVGSQRSEDRRQKAEIGEQRTEDRGRFQRLQVRVRGWLGATVTKFLGMEGCSLNILPTGLHKVLNASDADVIHLHWINNEMISINEIAKIKKPLVWTLHDCWPFLGAEHHSAERNSAGVVAYWSRGVGSCESEDVRECGGVEVSEPKVSSLKSKVSFAIFRKKQRAWEHLSVHFVAPSNWMAEQVGQSRLFADAPVEVIPNGLDANVFKPMDKAECRKKFDLPQDKNLILFGAYNPLDLNKGSDLLEQALLGMSDKIRGETELVVFGLRAIGAYAPEGSEGEHNIAGLKTHWMGRIFSEKKLAELYNAADVVCVPSRRESFGQTASESLACGIPVVAFRTTGLMDIVDHNENGYLAEPFDAGDLAGGLRWVLSQRTVVRGQMSATGNQQSSNDSLSINGRKKAKCCFANEIVARDYATLYEEVLRAD